MGKVKQVLIDTEFEDIATEDSDMTLAEIMEILDED